MDNNKQSYEKFEFLAALQKDIKLCRDFYKGGSKFKEDKCIHFTYAKKINKKQNNIYLATRQDFITRSVSFSNYYRRFVDGFTSLVFQKDPNFKNIEGIDLEDMDMFGNNFADVLRKSFVSSLIAGCEFICVEYSAEHGRAYLKRRKYEDLQYFECDNYGALNYIVFKEEIKIAKNGNLHEYEQEIHYWKGGGKTISKDTVNGQNRNKVLSWKSIIKDEIPIVCISTGIEESRYVFKPLLVDIANDNDCLLCYEMMKTNLLVNNAYPLMIVYPGGGSQKEERPKITNNEIGAALYLGKKGETGGEYLSVNPEAISIYVDLCKEIIDNMNKLCFDILNRSQSKTILEAHEHSNKGSSFIRGNISQLINKSMKILKWVSFLQHSALPKEAEVDFKNSFDELIVNRENIPYLITLFEKGVIKSEAIVDELKKMGVVSDGVVANKVDITKDFQKENSTKE